MSGEGESFFAAGEVSKLVAICHVRVDSWLTVHLLIARCAVLTGLDCERAPRGLPRAHQHRTVEHARPSPLSVNVAPDVALTEVVDAAVCHAGR